MGNNNNFLVLFIYSSLTTNEEEQIPTRVTVELRPNVHGMVKKATETTRRRQRYHSDSWSILQLKFLSGVDRLQP
jgi:hypothetical protein